MTETWLQSLHGMDWVGILAGATFVLILTKAQFDRNNPIDFTDVLVERVDGKRRVTLSKLTGLATSCVGIWAFLYSVTSNHIDRDWTGIVAFCAAGWGYRISDKVWGQPKQDPPATPPGKVTQ